MNLNFVPIVLATDDNYIEPTATTISSILLNAAKDTFYEINILACISDENKSKIEQLASLNKNVEFKFIDIKEFTKNVDLSSCMGIDNRTHYISEATYYRFFLPEIFADYDKILYLDVDMIILSDMADLFNKKLEEAYAAVVKDSGIEEIYRKNHKCNKRNITIREFLDDIINVKPEKYFNAGMMLFNLKKMREDNIKEKLFEFLKENQPLDNNDQDVLNAVLSNKLVYLDKKWNYYSFNSYNPNTAIIHFVCSLKPWLIKRDCYFEKWWFYFKQTPFWSNEKESKYKELAQKPYYLLHIGQFNIFEYRQMGFEKRMELKLFNRLKLRWDC